MHFLVTLLEFLVVAALLAAFILWTFQHPLSGFGKDFMRRLFGADEPSDPGERR